MAKRGPMTGKRKTFRLNNMTGLMNTMAEENAYLTFDPNAALGAGLTQIPFEFKNVTNWQPINRGGMSKATGFTLHKNVGSSVPIRALGRYINSSGTSTMMVAYGGNVYTLVAGTLTSLGTTIANVKTHFEIARDYLIICDSTNIPRTWDGSSVAALAAGADGTACTGFAQTLFYKNRVWGFSKTHDHSLLYYSDGDTLSTNFSTNFINCDKNDGQKITGIAKFFIPGALEPLIIVTKERGIGVIQGDGTAGDPFTYVAIAQDFGVPGFGQIVQFEQDVAFLTPRGISSYATAVQDNANIVQRMLSKNVFNQFSALSQTHLPNSLGWFDWKNRRLTFAVPSNNAQYPDTLWHYDVDLRGMYKQTGFTTSAAFVDTDGTLYTGTDTGLIYAHSQSVYAYNDAAISATLQTPYLDFFEPDYYKRIVHGKITVRGDGAYSLGVGTSLNYGTSQGSSHTVPVTSGSYTWNGGTWTSDSGVYQWGAAPLKHKKFYPGNIFENISFSFTQSGADQPVDLLEVLLEVEYLDLI